jgi:hypothetical protein
VRTEDELQTEEASLIVACPGDQIVCTRSREISSIIISEEKQKKIVFYYLFKLSNPLQTKHFDLAG